MMRGHGRGSATRGGVIRPGTGGGAKGPCGGIEKPRAGHRTGARLALAAPRWRARRAACAGARSARARASETGAPKASPGPRKRTTTPGELGAIRTVVGGVALRTRGTLQVMAVGGVRGVVGGAGQRKGLNGGAGRRTRGSLQAMAVGGVRGVVGGAGRRTGLRGGAGRRTHGSLQAMAVEGVRGVGASTPTERSWVLTGAARRERVCKRGPETGPDGPRDRALGDTNAAPVQRAWGLRRTVGWVAVDAGLPLGVKTRATISGIKTSSPILCA